MSAGVRCDGDRSILRGKARQRKEDSDAPRRQDAKEMQVEKSLISSVVLGLTDLLLSAWRLGALGVLALLLVFDVTLLLILRQPVVELAEAYAQLGGGGVAVSAVAIECRKDMLPLD